MQWVSLAEFLAMGVYGVYVWTAFGVTALCMVWEVLALRRRRGAASEWVPERSVVDGQSR